MNLIGEIELTEKLIGLQRSLTPTYLKSLKLIEQIVLSFSTATLLQVAPPGGQTEYWVDPKIDRAPEVTSANTLTKFEIDWIDRTEVIARHPFYRWRHLVAKPNIRLTGKLIGFQRSPSPTHLQSLKLIGRIELKLSRSDLFTGGATWLLKQTLDQLIGLQRSSSPTHLQSLKLIGQIELKLSDGYTFTGGATWWLSRTFDRPENRQGSSAHLAQHTYKVSN